jgi:hypothetical protein
MSLWKGGKGEGEKGGVQVGVCLVKNLLIFVYDESKGRHRECFCIKVYPLAGVIVFAGDVLGSSLLVLVVLSDDAGVVERRNREGGIVVVSWSF